MCLGMVGGKVSEGHVEVLWKSESNLVDSLFSPCYGGRISLVVSATTALPVGASG